MTSGSPLWQLVFISFAAVLILFEVLRGWRRGVARQVARLGALIAAYFTAVYAGGFVGPFLRPLLRMPDFAMSIVAGTVLGALVYLLINGLGMMLFKRTRQHQSAVVRMLCGASGALLGLFFGAVLVWIIIFGIRSLGSVAEGQVKQEPTPSANTPRAVHAVDLRRRNEMTDDSATVMTSLARLKNSLELGAFGELVKKSDVVPTRTYEVLEKVVRVSSDPQSAQRFLSYPGVHELSEHPKIVALRNDPEIADMILQWRVLDLLQNEKIRDAANDRELLEELKKFDLEKALDYALEQK